MSPVRVLVIDDSPTMRMLIAHALRQDPDIEVVGQAGDAFEAREAIKSLDPDVLTLDVEMPKMQGLEFLEKIMRLRPMPVIMISNQTGPGTGAAIEALAIGAFDCFTKPKRMADGAFEGLAATVKLAAASRRRLAGLSERRAASHRDRSAPPASPQALRTRPDVIGIGASTGGIEALSSVLADWPVDAPPTLIVQHLPAGFTTGFAQRLQKLSPARVAEAEDGMPLESGQVYLAPGGRAHLQVVGAGRPICRLIEAAPVNGHRPSVDVLFHSLARRFGRGALGIVLTGMGSDGARGALEIRNEGGWTIGQDEATSLVYGMPKAAAQLGAIQDQLPLDGICRALFGASDGKPLACR